MKPALVAALVTFLFVSTLIVSVVWALIPARRLRRRLGRPAPVVEMSLLRFAEDRRAVNARRRRNTGA